MNLRFFIGTKSIFDFNIIVQANFNDFDNHDNDEFTFQYFLVEVHQCDGSAENYVSFKYRLSIGDLTSIFSGSIM